MIIRGTDADDRLRGTVGRDTLLGFGGNDRLAGLGNIDVLSGGLGNDILAGNEGNDRLFGDADNDRLAGNDGNDRLLGGADNDRLAGGTGNDFLDGGAGNDRLAGGAGDDVYVLTLGDRLAPETRRGGFDTIRASFTLRMPRNYEELILVGRTRIDGIGNGGNNRIVGNSGKNSLRGRAGNDVLEGGRGADTLQGDGGDDRLDGGAGIDRLFGGLGNDTYLLGMGDDVGGETATGGIDTIQVTFSMANLGVFLPNFFENLILTGSQPMAGRGNNLNNAIQGNAGANDLEGQAGNDILTGGAGNDRFAYIANAAVSDTLTTFGQDTITDFVPGTDKILLDRTAFSALPDLDLNGEFAIVTSDTLAATSPALIVYNSTNGRLFYNADGAGAGINSFFATLAGNPVLSATDFVIQA